MNASTSQRIASHAAATQEPDNLSATTGGSNKSAARLEATMAVIRAGVP